MESWYRVFLVMFFNLASYFFFSEVLRAVTLNSTILWDVTPCSLV